jgi:Holliday junction resolvase RusA-like endonuclease
VVIRVRSLKQLEALVGFKVRPPGRRPRAPRRKRQEDLSRPGTVVASFEVSGLAVPWRAPITGAGGQHYTPEHVNRWKETVALAARDAGLGESNGVAPYQGPVYLVVYICRKAPRGREPGDRWDARPDADNLFKGLGDAISGNVFKEAGEGTPARLMPPCPVGRILADDKLVTDVDIRKRYWHRSLCHVSVVAVARHDPGPYPFQA